MSPVRSVYTCPVSLCVSTESRTRTHRDVCEEGSVGRPRKERKSVDKGKGKQKRKKEDGQTQIRWFRNSRESEENKSSQFLKPSGNQNVCGSNGETQEVVRDSSLVLERKCEHVVDACIMSTETNSRLDVACSVDLVCDFEEKEAAELAQVPDSVPAWRSAADLDTRDCSSRVSVLTPLSAVKSLHSVSAASSPFCTFSPKTLFDSTKSANAASSMLISNQVDTNSTLFPSNLDRGFVLPSNMEFQSQIDPPTFVLNSKRNSRYVKADHDKLDPSERAMVVDKLPASPQSPLIKSPLSVKKKQQLPTDGDLESRRVFAMNYMIEFITSNSDQVVDSFLSDTLIRFADLIQVVVESYILLETHVNVVDEFQPSFARSALFQLMDLLMLRIDPISQSVKSEKKVASSTVQCLSKPGRAASSCVFVPVSSNDHSSDLGSKASLNVHVLNSSSLKRKASTNLLAKDLSSKESVTSPYFTLEMDEIVQTSFSFLRRNPDEVESQIFDDIPLPSSYLASFR